MAAKVTAHVHRFQNFAAVAFCGIDGETVYMTADDARRLAHALHACASDIDVRTFTASAFPSESFTLANKGSRYA